MDSIIKYLKNNEYAIVSPYDIIKSENFDLIVKNKIDDNLYKYKNNFYSMEKNIINLNNIEYEIIKFLDITTFIDEINLLKEKLSFLKKDILTNLPNRREIENYLEKLDSKAIIAISDIDNFKGVNDTYGHIKGDCVLTILGNVINANLDSNDFAGRFGGEEFLFVFKNSSMDKVKEKLKKISLEFYNASLINSTMSIGIYEYNLSENIKEVINKADKALYYVKKHGKNNIVLYDEIKNLL